MPQSVKVDHLTFELLKELDAEAAMAKAKAEHAVEISQARHDMLSKVIRTEAIRAGVQNWTRVSWNITQGGYELMFDGMPEPPQKLE